MADSWYVSGNPMNQLGQTIGRSPNGQPLPSVTNAAQQQSNAANAAMLEAYFAEERRRWDASYGQNQAKLDREYELAKRTAKTAEAAQALDDWYKRESAGLARERLKQDQYEFEQTHSLNQAKLGYDLLGMGANLRGSRNALQYQRLASGMAANPNTATLFGNLESNVGQGGFQAFGPGEPEPMTLRALYEDMTGTGSNSAASANNVADMERERQAVLNYAKNPHLMAPGTWEKWGQDKRDLFSSMAEGSGIDMPTFLSGYGRSRPGQAIAATRAA